MKNNILKKIATLFCILVISLGFSTPCLANNVDPIHSIAISQFTTAVLTQSGKLICYGSSEPILKEPTYQKFTNQEHGGYATINGKWIHVAASSYTLYAIKSDGTLWASGFNDVGQIGNGTTVTQNRFVQIGKGRTWKKVSGVYGGAIALASDGSLWMWGLPNGSKIPKRLGAANHWKDLTNGVAIKTDGTLWDAQTQKLLYGATDYKKIVKGDGHYLLLKKDGTLWGMGNNNQGQLLPSKGKWDETVYRKFIKISDSTWSDICANSESSFGIKKDGTLWSWGSNACYTLGLEPSYDSTGPYLISNGYQFKSFPLSEAGSQSHYMFALDQSGLLWGWGNAGNGGLIPELDTIALPTKVDFINKQIKGITIEKNGIEKYYSKEILSENGRIFIPVSLLQDAFGATCSYDSSLNKGTLQYGKKTLSYTIDSSKIIVNDSNYTMIAPAKLYKSSAYLPLAAINHYLGLNLTYKASEKKLYLTPALTINTLTKGKSYLAEYILERNKTIPALQSILYNPSTYKSIQRTELTLTHGDLGDAIYTNGPIVKNICWLDQKRSSIGIMLNQYIETMPKILFFKDNELIGHLETNGVYYDNALYYTSDSATQLLKQSDHIGIVLPGYTNILILDTPTTLEVNTSY